MTAAGWDALAASGRGDAARFAASRRAGAGVAGGIALAAAVAVAGCVYFTTPTAFRILGIARAIGVQDAIGAAESMLRDLPGHATEVLLLALAALALLCYGAGARRDARLARVLLYGLIVMDLLVHAWGVNPVFDTKFLAQPEWMSFMPDNGDARFYVGGKYRGTLNGDDPDSSRAYYGAEGLTSSGSRAALSNQAAFYPSAWRRREILSHDLAVLWPREYGVVTERFRTATGEERDRFLDRTGVRYRILPPWRSEGHQPLTPIPYFLDSSLYDWGEAQPRAAVVGQATVVADRARALELLFDDGWNSRSTAILEREPAPAGQAGAPVEPFARFTADGNNRVALEAGARAGGGYLVLLDSYADDWHADVDGRPADVVRADGLFRAVKLAPGRHHVTFTYRPRAFYVGAAISGALLLVVIGLAARRERPAIP